ncbi:S-adenosyl-L-methionine-dependent methyltransferase [Pisolithus microcarpus]|nr:S-adenosyl-L-methionine-dependent methyltransferase [Pisolithus microcarpus]
MSAPYADGRQQKRVERYTKFWQKDLTHESDTDNKNRLDKYTDVVNGYYDGATELYEYGWAQSFHFSRFYKGEGFLASLARHEHYLAAHMGLKPGMRIVGINNNEFQLGRARRYTEKAGLSDQITYVKGDFMKLSEQFGANSFDAVYCIEATVHAPTWEGAYGEIFKVLKPGGVFGVYEWCMTDAWDPSIPSHKELAHQIEFGSGIPELRPIKLARQAMKNSRGTTLSKVTSQKRRPLGITSRFGE